MDAHVHVVVFQGIYTRTLCFAQRQLIGGWQGHGRRPYQQYHQQGHAPNFGRVFFCEQRKIKVQRHRFGRDRPELLQQDKAVQKHRQTIQKRDNQRQS